MANPHQDARDGNGRYTRRIETAERDAQAARLAQQRHTYQQIADELGYSSKGDAWRAVQRCRQAAIQQAGEELLASEAAHLDQLYVEALEVLARDHMVVSHGQIVRGPDGEPLLDDGPKLAAIDRLVKVRESYRKLFGVDTAQKVNLSGGVRYEIVGVDPSDLT
jgi:AraC-like DNA-binding protein